MRSPPILGLFLSFCLPSMGHVAKSPPTSLQSRDSDQHASVKKRVDGNDFGTKCYNYGFDEEKCVLTAHCEKDGKPDDRPESKLDINKCMSHFVMKGAPENLRKVKTFFDWKVMDNTDFERLDEKVGNLCRDKGPCKMTNLVDKGIPGLICERNPPLTLYYSGIRRKSNGKLEC
ncbi:hypothetical protein QBC32DRAFT_327935 [Pseudoneurospora amorphoporcata]|uniref:Uncharacterized protein n=1 Tax=Pseudoneurospora amorphoporcata TaxID=241081 RepID=A0AAN6SC70_9PEZI|nr:hypothetical protein QBC32DRAFT_327935 [Pseudoneurospora amorphoporcata]